MRKCTITKLIVQAVAVAFGLLGLMWIFGGFYIAVVGIRELDRFSVFFMIPMSFLLGGIVLAVAWQNLRHFGRESIQNVTALVALLVYTGLMTLVEPFQDATRDLKKELLYSATFLIPVLLAYLFYRVLSRKLIQLTETESSQQTESTDPSKASPGASSDVR